MYFRAGFVHLSHRLGFLFRDPAPIPLQHLFNVYPSLVKPDDVESCVGLALGVKELLRQQSREGSKTGGHRPRELTWHRGIEIVAS